MGQAPHKLSRADARRIAVRAQLLDEPRPADLLAVVRGLSLLQVDHTAAVAPSADLVLWTRLGSSYDPADLTRALEQQTLIELRSMIRPAEDIVEFRTDMASWPGDGEIPGWRADQVRWVAANDRCRRDILTALAMSGPMTARELPDTCAVPWSSSGWTNNKNVSRLLEFMAAHGEVAVVGREDRERLWDLAERVYPDVPLLPAAEALRLRSERRLRSLGIARDRGPESPVPMDLATVGEPAVIEDVKGKWRVAPEFLDGPFTGRAALLSPFDRLVYDRKRALALFDYDYQVEMYKPAAKRRWGYFALPILYGDRLVGKLDATADRAAGLLRIAAVHRDVTFTPE
ncbi:MAG TPA: crosslink repair DNA glycosylase YcaQ family protein, partial [Phytomonospora sp.]